MAQYITSLLELKARQDELPDEQKPVLSLDDLIYVVHGEGSDRDTVWTLAEFIAFLVANEKFDVLKLIKDENTDIPLYWDNDNTEFVIWDRENTNKVGLPKAHVHGTLEVEKDTTIRADVSITKTLTVAQETTFNSNVITKGYQVVENGLDARKRSVFQRINLGSNKSYFTVSSNTNINTLIAGVSEQIAVAEGDIVTLRNNSNTDIEVVMGLRKVTLNAFCAMQFICHGTDGTYTQWAPLGNATVTLA